MGCCNMTAARRPTFAKIEQLLRIGLEDAESHEEYARSSTDESSAGVVGPISFNDSTITDSTV